MREAILLLAVFALMALSAKVEGPEAFHAHGNLGTVSFERPVR